MPLPQLPPKLVSAPNATMLDALYDPLVLSAEVTLRPGADGVPNVAALKNPHGMPMELLAVRFSLYAQQYTGNDTGSITGGAVGVKMDLGDMPIVDSAVPLSVFASRRDSSDPTGPSKVIILDPTNANQYSLSAEAFYDWRLKYPLYIPANATVVPVFSHFGQMQFPITVRVTYFCRTYRRGAPKPTTRMVPWVTSYNSKVFDVLNSTPADSDESNEMRLVNNFNVPVEVSRIVGRYTFMALDPQVLQDLVNNEIIDSYDLAQLISLRISTSRGDEIARDQTAFDGLFPFNWWAWDLPDGWHMEPTEFWKVLLNRAAMTSSSVDGRVQVFVGVVGYREISAGGK